MLNINTFALVDEFWKGTKYCGTTGSEILNILKSSKGIIRGDFKFDVEFETLNGKSVIPG